MSAQNITRIALFAGFLAVGAYLRIPVGPVPLTMQSAAAVLAGYCLGPWYGALAALLYMGIGLAGLPVFAMGGGPAYVFTPTFGYIIGFVVATITTGMLADMIYHENALTAYIAMTGGLIDLYIIGLLWLTASMHWLAKSPESFEHILRIGLLVPIPGDLIMLLPTAIIGVRIRRLIRYRDSAV